MSPFDSLFDYLCEFNVRAAEFNLQMQQNSD